MKSILSLAMILIILASPAWAGCGRWVVRDNTDFLADPLFDAAMESSTGINDLDGSEESQAANQGENNSTATSAVAVVQKEDPIIDLAGKWRMSLTGDGTESAKIMDIILIQSGERLQGYGSITEGDSDALATATGAVSEDEISLEVKVNSQQEDYRLDMVHENGRLQGSYALYQAERLAESGNATASRTGR
ncbi:MAG TPA: hypothetical protein PKI26_08935 [Methanothrix sp.]|jgi:hypothetical protein|nr:hypothetical protein [Methanothrix sp.]